MFIFPLLVCPRRPFAGSCSAISESLFSISPPRTIDRIDDWVVVWLARVVRCRTGCDTTGNRSRSVRCLLVLSLLVRENLLIESLLRDVFLSAVWHRGYRRLPVLNVLLERLDGTADQTRESNH